MEKPPAKSSKGRTWTLRRVGKLARELGIDIEVDLARRIVRVRGATSGKPSAIGNDLDDWMAKRDKNARQA